MEKEDKLHEYAMELQEILVQDCINYLKGKDIGETFVIHFYVDDIKSSIDFGKWHCCSDSSISFADSKKNVLTQSI